MKQTTNGPIERFDDLPAELVDALDSIRGRAEASAIVKRDGDADRFDRLSVACLQSEYLGRPRSCRAIEGRTLAYRITADDAGDLSVVLQWLRAEFGGDEFRLSGRLIYPRGGWLGWHTNADFPGRRWYFNHNAADAGGFLRVAELESGRVFDDFDVAGWQLRAFDVPVWHCVGARAERFSFGTRRVDHQGATDAED